LLSKGKKIPCDGSPVPLLIYLETLAGYDLSKIIGYKDNCPIEKVVLKNDEQKDTSIIDSKAGIEKITNKPRNLKEDTSDKKVGVHKIEGQKSEEIKKEEKYEQSIKYNRTPPKKVFLNFDFSIMERILNKFKDIAFYDQSYIKYL